MTLGSPAAFAAGSVWRGFRAKQSNTPSVSRQKQAADTSLGEGGCKGKVKRKVKQLFIFYPIKDKSPFIFFLIFLDAFALQQIRHAVICEFPLRPACGRRDRAAEFLLKLSHHL
ncbi:hypothetical protein [Cloacibacillus porcorum]|uniref:hypothetical protein n=1 Tax=Cloacibacillus porcorum TaxID=1197717 RepID=UPI003F0E75C1